MRTSMSWGWVAPANESPVRAPFALDANALMLVLNQGEQQARRPEWAFTQKFATGDDMAEQSACRLQSLIQLSSS